MRRDLWEWVDEAGCGIYTTHYEQLGDAGQAKLDERLDYLLQQPAMLWREPHAKKLAWCHDDDCKDLYEIRFTDQRTQQRPMGYFARRDTLFFVVVWVTKKGKQYRPSTWSRQANARRADCGHPRRSRQVEID